MEVFRQMSEQGHEQVAFFHHPEFGLKGIVAIHDTTLGPALGGCRMWKYATDEEALTDALRLSRAMTYKAAVAGLDLGGGKSVIIGNPKTDKNEELWRAFGRFVEGLGGRYITAEDVGTSVEDMEIVSQETRFVTGLSKAHGGSGDPSAVTARGVFVGIKAAVLARLGRDTLDGLKVAIQGVGHVGMYLAKYLHEDGVELFLTDIDHALVDLAVRDFDAVEVAPDAVYDLDVDVFAPCALGATVNEKTIPRLKCSIVAGGANNVLADAHRDGMELMRRNVLYAPDYVINAGGLINVCHEIKGYDEEAAHRQAEDIYDTLLEIFQLSKNEHLPPNEASDRVAENRIRAVQAARPDRLSQIFIREVPRQQEAPSYK